MIEETILKKALNRAIIRRLGKIPSLETTEEKLEEAYEQYFYDAFDNKEVAAMILLAQQLTEALTETCIKIKRLTQATHQNPFLNGEWEEYKKDKKW